MSKRPAAQVPTVPQGERKSTQTVFDLDELFHARTPLKVRMMGAEYPLKRPEELDPIDFVRLQQVEARIDALKSSGNATELNEQNAQDMKAFTEQMIAILCPALAAVDPPVPFGPAFRLISWYMDQVRDEPGGKKKKG